MPSLHSRLANTMFTLPTEPISSYRNLISTPWACLRTRMSSISQKQVLSSTMKYSMKMKVSAFSKSAFMASKASFASA